MPWLTVAYHCSLLLLMDLVLLFLFLYLASLVVAFLRGWQLHVASHYAFHISVIPFFILLLPSLPVASLALPTSLCSLALFVLLA